MERVINKDISVTRYPTDGFMLSYITDGGEYYKRRYIGYSVATAKRLFKRYVRDEARQ
jgi:hypothetical protein